MTLYRKFKPYGILMDHTGREYWLLKPQPIEKDSWFNDDCFWFLVSPLYTREQYELGETYVTENDDAIYPSGRQLILHGNWSIELKDCQEINLEYAGSELYTENEEWVFPERDEIGE